MVPSLSVLSNQHTVFNQLTNSTQLRHAYSAVLTVTMASDQSFYEAFREAQMSREIHSAVSATEVNKRTTTNTGFNVLMDSEVNK